MIEFIQPKQFSQRSVHCTLPDIGEAERFKLPSHAFDGCPDRLSDEPFV